ncbi:unnamed protein product, partial [Ectocarpus sp. 8 AP-2014]
CRADRAGPRRRREGDTRRAAARRRWRRQEEEDGRGQGGGDAGASAPVQAQDRRSRVADIKRVCRDHEGAVPPGIREIPVHHRHIFVRPWLDDLGGVPDRGHRLLRQASDRHDRAGGPPPP